jgi:hypothetical protein
MGSPNTGQQSRTSLFYRSGRRFRKKSASSGVFFTSPEEIPALKNSTTWCEISGQTAL